MKRYCPDAEYIGSGDYIGSMTECDDGDYVKHEDARALLNEALEAMLNMAPRIRDERGGCFGDGGQDCACTACRIRRELRR